MDVLGSLGISEETVEDLKGYAETAQSWSNEAVSIGSEVAGYIADGQATLQDLGLLPKPPGAPDGGRWALSQDGTAVYLEPDFVLSSGPGTPRFTVGEVPAWFPVGNFAFETALRKYASIWFALGATEQDIASISGLDPISGIAPAGTAFEELSPEQQRAYMANSYVIGVARNMDNPIAAQTMAAVMKEKWRGLSWAPLGGPGFEMSNSVQEGIPGLICQGSVISSDGRPYFPMSCDMDEAARRLFGVVRGITSASGADFGSALQTSSWSECLMPGMSQPDLAACVERYESQPGFSQAFEAVHGPWRPFAEPGKTVQVVDGLDAKSYLVVSAGGKQVGMKATTAAMGVVGAAILGGAAIGSVWLLFTKKGKKRLRKILR